jgi:hypothetical protein
MKWPVQWKQKTFICIIRNIKAGFSKCISELKQKASFRALAQCQYRQLQCSGTAFTGVYTERLTNTLMPGKGR